MFLSSRFTYITYTDIYIYTCSSIFNVIVYELLVVIHFACNSIFGVTICA